jgi:hypothetical protein
VSGLAGRSQSILIPVGANDIMVIAHRLFSSLKSHKLKMDAKIFSARREWVFKSLKHQLPKFPARFKTIIEENN